jgi:hypothetical protein
MDIYIILLGVSIVLFILLLATAWGYVLYHFIKDVIEDLKEIFKRK